MMINVWCIRAEYGTYTPQFLKGGYAAVGWADLPNLSKVTTREQLYELYRQAYPQDSNFVAGQQVGQLARFVLEIANGDVVITPDANSDLLRHGRVSGEPSYAYEPNDSACPYPHRRKVIWSGTPILRSGLSVPLQNTLRSSLTVFSVSQVDEVLAAAGLGAFASPASPKAYDPTETVLEQVLQLGDKEFEILVSHLLNALGFDGSEVVGKTGDGGVDATGELNVANLAKVKVFVQAKRYKRDTTISASTVRQLRQAIPFGGQGAFITTADFQKKALEVAVEAGFPRIGLVNGSQLVDLLVAHWDAIPAEFQELLGLKPGLVLA
jgi:restriction system protein